MRATMKKNLNSKIRNVPLVPLGNLPNPNAAVTERSRKATTLVIERKSSVGKFCTLLPKETSQKEKKCGCLSIRHAAGGTNLNTGKAKFSRKLPRKLQAPLF